MPSLRASLGKKSLEDLLEEAGGVAVGSDGARTRVPKALQKTLKENYQEIYNSVERLMKEDLGSQTEGPGLPQSSGTFRGWVEHRSRIPAIPTNCRLAWILAGALHTLNQGDIPGAKATLGLGLASLDRLAIDRGQWLVAAECSLEPLGPPISCFQRHQLPTLEEAQHSRLLDPRWIEAFYQKVKDLDDYVERKLARSRGQFASGVQPQLPTPEPESERERGNSCPQATTQKEGRKGREQGNRSREGKQLKERACEL